MCYFFTKYRWFLKISFTRLASNVLPIFVTMFVRSLEIIVLSSSPTIVFIQTDPLFIHIDHLFYHVTLHGLRSSVPLDTAIMWRRCWFGIKRQSTCATGFRSCWKVFYFSRKCFDHRWMTWQIVMTSHSLSLLPTSIFLYIALLP